MGVLDGREGSTGDSGESRDGRRAGTYTGFYMYGANIRCGSTGKRGCDRCSEEVSSGRAEESREVVGPEIDARQKAMDGRFATRGLPDRLTAGAS